MYGKVPDTTEQQTNERNIRKLGEVHKVGNLTRDLDVRYSPNGTGVVRSGLAVDRPKVAGDWSGEQVTDFYELTIFNQLGQNASKSLAKGTRVVVVGDAEVDNWTGDDGQERTTKRIIVKAIGPDLRWATATVERTNRPMSRPPTERPETALGDANGEEEPF
jgi:single-strand DNA-binding protein